MSDSNDIHTLIPKSFIESISGRPADQVDDPEWPDGDTWLARLPAVLRDCLDQWTLSPADAAHHGACAVVLPCDGPLGRAVLKVSWPHREATHEHLVLRAWGGTGAVRLLAADPNRWAMLLETLDAARELSGEDIDRSTEVIGGLLRRLDRPALPQLTCLSTESARWAEQIRTFGPRVLPRRLVERASAIFDGLGQEQGVDGRLIHTDLHDMNVLAAEREPWLAIDPKPLAGLPEFGVAPLVWNRADDAHRSPSIRAHLRRRVEIACEAGDLDVDRAMLWTLARCAQNAAGAAADGIGTSNDLLSWWVTCAKAMQN